MDISTIVQLILLGFSSLIIPFGVWLFSLDKRIGKLEVEVINLAKMEEKISDRLERIEDKLDSLILRN